MSDDLRRRVAAVERAVTGGETDLAGVADAATLDARLTAVETRLDELTTRLDTLDAATQSLRGYLGGVDDVSADVERRADLALAKAEALETAVFDGTDDALAVERLPLRADQASPRATRPDGEATQPDADTASPAASPEAVKADAPSSTSAGLPARTPEAQASREGRSRQRRRNRTTMAGRLPYVYKTPVRV
jgi:hypothetical protein